VKVFLDTNVLVSAFATRGLSVDLFELVLMEHELLTGRRVLQELARVLRVKLKLPPSRCAEIEDLLESEAATVVAGAAPADTAADEDDRRVLGEALAGHADVFVTGDAALLALTAVDTMRVLSPRQLWEALRSDEPPAK
jgi:putative PIN family toxin of toxin-antitoxin system